MTTVPINDDLSSQRTDLSASLAEKYVRRLIEELRDEFPQSVKVRCTDGLQFGWAGGCADLPGRHPGRSSCGVRVIFRYEWSRGQGILTLERPARQHSCGRTYDELRLGVIEALEDSLIPVGPIDADTDVVGELAGVWNELWALDDTVRWLVDGVIEEGGLHALVGPPKCGKSLLALEWAVGLAQAGRNVLYLDEENLPIEIRRRLQDMGHGPRDLALLDHRSFEGWTVDTEDGAAQIIKAAGEVYDLVVFDSWARFFSCGNQSSEAAANFAYANVLKPLMLAGTTVLRLDHTGHEGRRPSGTVVKLADVTHGWHMNAKDSTVTLTHTENRTGRGLDTLRLTRELGPLRHVRQGPPGALAPLESGQGAEDAVLDAVELLDSLSIPVDWSRPRAAGVLRQAGHRVSNETLAAAVRRRRVAA